MAGHADWNDPSEHDREDIEQGEHAVLDTFYSGDGDAAYVEIDDLIGEIAEALADVPEEEYVAGHWAEDAVDRDDIGAER